jgi:C4-dicarboxylate-specific signal transduction histidine kinase
MPELTRQDDGGSPSTFRNLLDGGADILPFSPAFAAGLALAIFLVDTFTPFDVAIAVLYVGVVLLSLNFATRRQLLLIGAGCGILTVLGFLLSHGIDAPAGPMARGAVSLVAIAISTGLAIRVKSGIEVLRESERRYRNIFLASGVAILEMDFSRIRQVLAERRVPSVREALSLMRVNNANETTMKMFGARDIADYRSALPRLVPAEMEPALEGMLEAIARGDRYFESETAMHTVDGRRIDVLTTVALPADRPELDQVLVSVMDVTASREAARRLDETRDELARISRVATLGELTASIAHEVNQPLAAIVTNGQAGLRWLNRTEPDLAEGRAALTRIVTDAERASDVIKRLRSLSTRGVTQHVPVDLNTVVADALALGRAEFRTRQVEVSFDARPDPPMVSGDPVQLQQVVINLVVNAVQAMTKVEPDRRKLDIELAAAANEVVLAVSDSGPGLKPDQAEQIFSAFYTTKPEGMGMGLSISRSIVEAHGGRIAAGASPSGGARFTVTLPTLEAN